MADSPSYLTKSITIRGMDGNDIRVSETAERQEVVVSITHNAASPGEFRTATVRLTRRQFDSLCESKYSLEVKTEPEEAQPDVQE